MIEMTEAFMASCKNPGAILFECTNMCPFSRDVAEVWAFRCSTSTR